MELLNPFNYFYIGFGTHPSDVFGVIVFFLSILAGGILWPLRYGMFEDEINMSLKRISWTVHLRKAVVSFLMAVPTVIITHNLSFLILALAMYLIVPANWLRKADDLGRIEGNGNGDIRVLAKYGAVLGFEIAVIIYLLGLTLLEAFGIVVWFTVTTPLAYYLGWRIFDQIGVRSKYLLDGRHYGRIISGMFIATGLGLIISF